MLRKICLPAIILLLAVELHAINISVNSELWKSYSGGETVFDRSGANLEDLAPVLFDAWTLSIETSSGESRVLSRDDLCETLSSIAVIKKNGGFSVILPDGAVENVLSVNIEGEKLRPRPLEIWISWEGTDLLKTEIERYAELHELEINVLEVPKPASKLISVSRSSGGVPDIIMVQSGSINSLVKSECIQNVDFFYPSGLIESGRAAFSLEGRSWAVPFYYDAQMFFYNPEIISSVDDGWTFDDYEKLCSDLKTSGVDIPSSWNAYSASFLIPFQMAFGKESLINGDGSITITDLPTKDALDYVLDLKERELMIPMERDAMTSLFISGEAAMIISASYSIPHFQKLGIPFRAAPFPVNRQTGRRASPLLDFKAFAITKKTRNTTGARRLIEYLCSEAVQQRFSSGLSKLPARTSALEQSGNPFYRQLMISSECGTVIPVDKAYSVYKNTMWKMLRFGLSGRMDSRQLLEKTQTLVDKNLNYN